MLYIIERIWVHEGFPPVTHFTVTYTRHDPVAEIFYIFLYFVKIERKNEKS